MKKPSTDPTGVNPSNRPHGPKRVWTSWVVEEPS